MRTDLEDALVPVKWAEAQISVLQRRIEAWHRIDPYRIVLEEYPDKPDWELLVAYPDKPLDHLIVGDVGAIISSVRTALNLLLSAVIARHGIQPERAPDFPISKTAADFEGTVKGLENKQWLSSTEADAIKRTKAYNGGDHVLFHIATLDNMRKHQRLLRVQPFLNSAEMRVAVIPILHGTPEKTYLFAVPSGRPLPAKGQINLAAEILLNEAPAGVGDKPALVALWAYIERVNGLITGFP